MNPIYFAVVIIAIVIFLYVISALSPKKSNNVIQETKTNDVNLNEELPYILKNSVLTKNEYTFYAKLKPITDKYNLTIVTKIRLADFISCKKNTEKFQSWFNKINSKHVDFLLCNNQLKPLVAIEVDDSTHDRPDRMSRDEFVDKVYKCVGLNILHIRHENSTENIDAQIKSIIENISGKSV